jgi:hypothetical protein
MAGKPPISLAGIVGTWQLDPKNTTVEFHTTAMWGLAHVTGTIRALHGNGTIGDGGEPRGSSSWTQLPSTPRSRDAINIFEVAISWTSVGIPPSHLRPRK